MFQPYPRVSICLQRQDHILLERWWPVNALKERTTIFTGEIPEGASLARGLERMF